MNYVSCLSRAKILYFFISKAPRISSSVITLSTILNYTIYPISLKFFRGLIQVIPSERVVIQTISRTLSSGGVKNSSTGDLLSEFIMQSATGTNYVKKITNILTILNIFLPLFSFNF